MSAKGPHCPGAGLEAIGGELVAVAGAAAALSGGSQTRPWPAAARHPGLDPVLALQRSTCVAGGEPAASGGAGGRLRRKRC